jgi:hypothetical protein
MKHKNLTRHSNLSTTRTTLCYRKIMACPFLHQTSAARLKKLSSVPLASLVPSQRISSFAQDKSVLFALAYLKCPAMKSAMQKRMSSTEPLFTAGKFQKIQVADLH